MIEGKGKEEERGDCGYVGVWENFVEERRNNEKKGDRIGRNVEWRKEEKRKKEETKDSKDSNEMIKK